MRNGKLMTTRVAAIALSSMMVLSPLTAFASSSNPNPPQQGQVYGDTIQADDTTYYLDDERDSNTGDVTAYFKKTLTLADTKNADYIPTVPDVIYNYTIEKSNFNAKVKSAIPSYNGATIFEGIEGGLSSTAKVEFSHKDDPVKDESGNAYKANKDGVDYTMTKLVEFTAILEKFRGADIGVYRYILTESEYKDIDSATAAPQQIKDDINEITEQYNQRFIDVVVQRANADPKSDERKISGIILHEIIKEQDPTTKEWKIKNPDVRKDEGYTPYSYSKNDGKEGPAEAHSKYTTFDLAVDKEVTGEGLTNDKAVAAYTFDVELDGPVGAEVQVVRMGIVTDGNPKAEGIAVDEVWTFDEKGKIKKEVSLQNNEWFEISGLPSGATYNVVEQAASAENMKVHTKLNSTKTEGAITMTKTESGKTYNYSQEENGVVAYVVDKINHDKVVELAGDGIKNGTDGAIEVKKLSELADVDVQNVLIVNEMPPITITGVVMNVAPYALMVIAAAIFAGLFISKKRQEEEI